MKRSLLLCLVLALGFLGHAASAEEAPLFTPEPAISSSTASLCETFDLTAPPSEEKIIRPNPQWCGDPCTTAGAESYCTGYRCNGQAARGGCTCLQGLFQLVWTCGWAC